MAQLDVWGAYNEGAKLPLLQQHQDMQNAQVGMGLLQHIQAQQQALQLRDALAKGDTAALMKLPGGIDILTKLQQQQQAGVKSQLENAQLGEIQRKAQEAAHQGVYRNALTTQLTQSQYSGENANNGAQTQLEPNDAAAIAAARQADAQNAQRRIQGLPEIPFNFDVNNPNTTKALIVGAGNSIPHGTASDILKSINPPTQAGFTLPAGATRYDSQGNPIAVAPEKTGSTDYTNIKENPLKPGEFIGFNKRTNRMEALPSDASTAPKSSGVTVDTHGEDFLKSLDPSTANTVKAISEGRMPVPSGFALKSPYWQNMMTLVGQYDPNYSSSRPSVLKDFTSGKTAQNITALNTAIGHIGTMYDLSQKLGEHDLRAINQLANSVGIQLGKDQVNNFDIAQQAVGDELMRVFKQVGSSQAEADSFKAKFNAASSPAQFKGAMTTAVELLQSRINAIDDQWKRGMGSDKSYPNLVSPKSQAILNGLGVAKTPIPTQSVVGPAGWSIRPVGQ